MDVNLYKNSDVHFPTLNLYGISIELALKAFLLQRGKSLSQVKNLSHSLTKAMKLARRHKLGRLVKFDAKELAAIYALDTTYSSGRLRYIGTEIITLPVALYISRAAEELVLGLEEYCSGSKARLRGVL